LIDEKNKIAFCGDWMNKEGRVEGAFLSKFKFNL
jgi:predicted NAD/FAD-dependent oxidoreductase